MSDPEQSLQPAPLVANAPDVVQTAPTLAQQVDQMSAQMQQLLQNALGCVMLQDTVSGISIEDSANHLYSLASRIMDPVDLLIMGIFRNLIAVCVALPRTLKYQLEARVQECQAECGKCREFCAEALSDLDRFPNPDGLDLGSIRVTFQFLSRMMTAIQASAEAEAVLLRNASEGYLTALNAAMAAFQAAAKVASGSADPSLQAMRRMATHQVDRLSIRTQLLSKPAPAGPEYLPPKGRKIFIVHGHNEARRMELKSLLEEQFNLETVVLADQASGGRTVIEKFEEFGNQCCYAFVLLTSDDMVVKDGKQSLQARPNALFELGWFFGHLGPNRICILKEQGTEIPSDLGGILYLEFQKSIGEKYLDMRKELLDSRVIGQSNAQISGA